MMCLAIDIGPKIEHVSRQTLLIGEWRADRRAIDAWKGAQDETGDGHPGARIACRYRGMRLSLLDQPERRVHGGITLAAHRLHRLIVHADHFCRRMDVYTPVPRPPAARQFGRDHIRLTNQNGLGVAVPLYKLDCRGNGYARPMIAAHDVDRYDYRHSSSAVLSSRVRAAPAECTRCRNV